MSDDQAPTLADCTDEELYAELSRRLATEVDSFDDIMSVALDIATLEMIVNHPEKLTAGHLRAIDKRYGRASAAVLGSDAAQIKDIIATIGKRAFKAPPPLDLEDDDVATAGGAG